MLTYNQEDYISQAIEGVLMQETNFLYELVIGEDCSTDQTTKICSEYAKKYPKIIKLLINENNLGLGHNYVKAYAECNGKYVAICDGDDYWIDPFKLQKQVDFLTHNPIYSIIYTKNERLFPTGIKLGPKEQNRPHTTNFENLVFENYITSVTVLFKNKPLLPEMNEWIKELPYGDWLTYLWITVDGSKIYFLNDTTAVYRKDFGTSTALRMQISKISEINLSILEKLEMNLNFAKQNHFINQSIVKYKLGLMASYNKEGRYLKSLINFLSLLYEEKSIMVASRYFYSLKRAILVSNSNL